MLQSSIEFVLSIPSAVKSSVQNVIERQLQDKFYQKMDQAKNDDGNGDRRYYEQEDYIERKWAERQDFIN